jgi:hypothetical protein
VRVLRLTDIRCLLKGEPVHALLGLVHTTRSTHGFDYFEVLQMYVIII